MGKKKARKKVSKKKARKFGARKKAQELAKRVRKPKKIPADRFDPECIFTSRAAAAFLGISVAGLAKWRRLGTGPMYQRTGQNRVTYLRKELIAWQANHASYRSTSEETVAKTASEGSK